MITELLTTLPEAKVRCDTCAKELLLFENTILTQGVIDLIRYKANQHERLHPQHKIEIMIWENAPESMDIEDKLLPIEKDMQKLLDSVRPKSK